MELRGRGLFLPEPKKLELRQVGVSDLIGDPPRTDMYVVRTSACGICGSDVSYFNGRNPWALHTLGVNMESDPNMILGHEVSGVIESDQGAAVSRVGQRVGIIAYKECGECPDCVRGRHNLCSHCDHIGHGEILPDGTRNSWHGVRMIPGGFSDYFTCWKDKLIPLPDSISSEEATQLDSGAVAVHGVDRGNIQTGGSVLVIGTGPVGFLASQVAAAYGAAKVVATDLYDGPLDRLGKVADCWRGCELVPVNTHRDLDEATNSALENTSGRGVDTVLDTVGSASTVVAGLRALRRGGRMVLFSGFDEEVKFDLKYLSGEREITSSCNNPFPDYPVAVSLMARGLLSAREMITHTYKLDQFDEAFRVACNKEEYDAVKVVITP